MSTNRSQGPVQVFDTSVVAINLALRDVQERLDALKGLRGRSMVYDRIRAEDPTVDTDVVTLGTINAGTAFASISLLGSPTTPLLVAAPGTSYVEVSTTLRARINFASPQSLEGRLLVQGWGTASGNGKGLALKTAGGATICEATWNGSSETFTIGSFTSITETLDQTVQLHAKGSTSTESLLCQSIVFDLRYAILVT